MWQAVDAQGSPACHMGMLLMFTVLKMVLMASTYEGSFSLEHPAENLSDSRQGCIWQSAVVTHSSAAEVDHHAPSSKHCNSEPKEVELQSN